jgi:general secretion pathway protein N
MAMARTPFGNAQGSAPWRTAVAGAWIGLALGAVAFAPASWLAIAVGTASGNQVGLAGAQGSIWRGSSQLVLSGGLGSGQAVALPGQIHWQVRPAWSGLRIFVGSDCCTQQPLEFQVAVTGFSVVRLEMGDGQSQWPAGLLAGLGTPWNTVQPQGQLVATTQNVAVEWERGRVHLTGRVQVDALRVSSRLSTLSPMGSYRVTLQGGPEPSLQLATLDGSLQLSGQGQWIGQRLRFNGIASAEPERVEALSNLLNIVGRRDGARSIITVG